MADFFLGNGLSVSGEALFLVDSTSLEDVATCRITHVYAMLQVQSQQKVSSNGDKHTSSMTIVSSSADSSAFGSNHSGCRTSASLAIKN